MCKYMYYVVSVERSILGLTFDYFFFFPVVFSTDQSV